MSCTLATIAACVSLYVDASVVATDYGIERAGVQREQSVIRRPGVIETVILDRTIYSNEPANPYGRLALGLRAPISKHCFGYAEVSHFSSLVTDDDHGINAAALGARCDIPLFGAWR